MKTSEMIEQLRESLEFNGDQELEIMIYGKSFTDIELNAVDDVLYVEGYIHDERKEDSFVRQYVENNKNWKQ